MASEGMEHYKAIDVWSRRDEGTVVRYRCFQLLPDGGYSVQSADYYKAPFLDSQSAQHEKQFLELFMEEDPKVRSPLFPTLVEAICAFDGEFDEPVTDTDQS
jgi:hypothetical protein